MALYTHNSLSVNAKQSKGNSGWTVHTNSSKKWLNWDCFKWNPKKNNQTTAGQNL